MATSDEGNQVRVKGPGGIGHNSTGSVSAAALVSAALVDLLIWPPAELLAADQSDHAIDGLVEKLEAAGQSYPAIARRVDGDRIEIVAGAEIMRAIVQRGEEHSQEPRFVEVLLYEAMSDERAYRMLARDAEEKEPPSALARGQFYGDAVKTFGGAAKAAKVLGVSESAISKNINTVKVLYFIGEKVEVHRDISQRDAMWLRGVIGLKKDGSAAPDAERCRIVFDTIKQMPIMPAKKLFAALRAALRETEPRKPRKGVVPITSGESEIGTVRAQKKTGKVTIELIDTGSIPLEDLMLSVQAAMARTRA